MKKRKKLTLDVCEKYALMAFGKRKGTLSTGELFKRALKKGLPNSKYAYHGFRRHIKNSSKFDTTTRGWVSQKGKGSTPKSIRTCSSTSKTTEKQTARDFVVSRIRKAFPDADQALRILSLPGTVGLSEPGSMEHQIRTMYPNSVMMGLEEKLDEFEQMRPLASEIGFSHLLHITDLKYFKHHWGIFDVIWLDYYGKTNPRVQESLRLLFEKEMLVEPSLLVITINEGRRGSSTALPAEDTYQYIKECGEICEYKIVKYGDVGYNQETGDPMRVSAFHCKT